MSKYTFSITEILERIITIEAENENDAYKKLKDLYYNEEIVLTADDFVDYKFELLETEGKSI